MYTGGELMSNYNFGNYICELREKKGLSQSELGKILGVTNKAISKWENGGAYPSAELMLPLAKALGISIEELYSAISNCKKEKSKLRKLLDAVASKSKILTIVCCSASVISWLLFLFFGNSPDKTFVLIATPIMSIIFYFVIRFSLAFESKMPLAPSSFIDFGVAFFLVMMAFSWISMNYYFIVDFPNGFYVNNGIAAAIFCGVLHFQKKRL
jgi:transcriptional regulator with XRE-family HTH domain